VDAEGETAFTEACNCEAHNGVYNDCSCLKALIASEKVNLEKRMKLNHFMRAVRMNNGEALNLLLEKKIARVSKKDQSHPVWQAALCGAKHRCLYAFCSKGMTKYQGNEYLFRKTGVLYHGSKYTKDRAYAVVVTRMVGDIYFACFAEVSETVKDPHSNAFQIMIGRKEEYTDFPDTYAFTYGADKSIVWDGKLLGKEIEISESLHEQLERMVSVWTKLSEGKLDSDKDVHSSQMTKRSSVTLSTVKSGTVHDLATKFETLQDGELASPVIRRKRSKWNNVENDGPDGLLEWNQVKQIILDGVDAELEEMSELLSKSYFDLNHANNLGETLLHVAASANNHEAVKQILAAHLEKGPSSLLEKKQLQINALDASGKSPLHRAFEENALECIKLFLNDTKADVNIVDKNGHSPFYYAVETIANYNNCPTLELLGRSPDFDREAAKAELATLVKKQTLTAVKTDNGELIDYLFDFKLLNKRDANLTDPMKESSIENNSFRVALKLCCVLRQNFTDLDVLFQDKRTYYFGDGYVPGYTFRAVISHVFDKFWYVCFAKDETLENIEQGDDLHEKAYYLMANRESQENDRNHTWGFSLEDGAKYNWNCVAYNNPTEAQTLTDYNLARETEGQLSPVPEEFHGQFMKYVEKWKKKTIAESPI